MAEGPSCSFAKYSPISCGFSKHYHLIREHVPLRTCNRDITSHLKRLKTSHANINGEWHLMLLRVGLFEVQGESLTICPLHRDVLGTLWNSSRPPTKCSHPLHRTSKAKPDRGVSPAFSKAIRDHWGRFVPTGSGKYRSSYKRLAKMQFSDVLLLILLKLYSICLIYYIRYKDYVEGAGNCILRK